MALTSSGTFCGVLSLSAKQELYSYFKYLGDTLAPCNHMQAALKLSVLKTENTKFSGEKACGCLETASKHRNCLPPRKNNHLRTVILPLPFALFPCPHLQHMFEGWTLSSPLITLSPHFI